MNLLYLKYAVEVAASGSINKAAEKLYMDQPNLSRCIKDLETSLGVSIFARSARGMKVTPEGEEFLKYAERILKQVDTVENMFRIISSGFIPRGSVELNSLYTSGSPTGTSRTLVCENISIYLYFVGIS